jgi:hypothetical protein
MHAVTLSVAAIASFLVFLLAPLYGLIIYIATIAWYPTYLAVPVATIDFTVSRMVILAIFAKLFLQTNLPNRFRFTWLDKLVIIYFAAQIVAGLETATSLGRFLENRSGAIFDMVLPYFAVRMIIRNRQQYLTLIKAVVIIGVPLALVGFYQCITDHNPASFFRDYYAWHSLGKEWAPAPRFGLFRASVVFPHPIMYGLFFAMFGPVCVGILSYGKRYKALYRGALGLMCVGVFSSMSMGPLVAALGSITFIAFYRWRKYWKPVVIIVIVMCGLVEIISNRHVYEVIDRLSFSSANAWYRSRLIEVALFEGGMSGHWLFGYNVDPGWGHRISGLPYTDMVNHYLAILCAYGLVGLVPLLTVICAAIKKLIESFRTCMTGADRWLVWCLVGGLFGILGAMNSTSLFGPPVTIFYMMLAFCGAMPAIVRQANQVIARRKPINKVIGFDIEGKV